MKTYKLSSGIDHDSHYLAQSPLEEIMSSLQPEMLCDASTSEPIAFFSVAVTKVAWHFSYLQMSEFIHRFGMCLFQDLHENQNVNFFGDIGSIILPVKMSLAAMAKQLEDSYRFHKCLITNLGNISKPSQVMYGTDVFQSFQITLHSLVLHMQSAFSKALNVETEVEHMEAENCDINKNPLIENAYEHLTNSLMSIKIEMDSCMTCIDESQQILDRHFGRSIKEKTEIPIPVNEDLKQQPLMKLHVVPDKDPVIEDQVFEAVVTHEDCNNICNEDEVEYYAERDKRREDAECSKKVLKELKSVLIVKADEWKVREESALSKMRRKVNGDMEEKNESISSLLESNPCNLDTEIKSIAEAKLDRVLIKSDADEQSSPRNNDTMHSANEDDSDTSNVSSEIIDTCDNRNLCELSKDNDFKIGNETVPLPLEEFIGSSDFSFVSNIAAMAAAKSQLFRTLPTQTFIRDVEEIFGSDVESD